MAKAKKILNRIHTEGTLECGIDECGRGALAGPVVAAAVVWGNDTGPLDEEIRDSKRLSAEKRRMLCDYIKDVHRQQYSR
jgi:ribonuclease HII